MKPYYQDDLVTLYHGRCEDVLPALDLIGSVHLLTDPPYFKVKDNDWDNQWSKSAEFLDWMGEWLDLAKPHLSADASVWVFASPQMSSAVESVVAARFRVLNSVRWVKPDSPSEKGWRTARAFLPLWEGIILAEQVEGAYDAEHYKARKRANRRVGDQLREYRVGAGLSRKSVANHLVGLYRNVHTADAMLGGWEIGKSMVTQQAHELLRSLYGGLPTYESLTREYDDSRAELEHMRAEYVHLRRPFALRTRSLSSDLFAFGRVEAYAGKHPAEKPTDLLTHMIETTTRPGDTILDCFSGSGAVLDVARQLGRKAVGIEMDKHWCKQTTKRLSQQAFDLEAIS